MLAAFFWLLAVPAILAGLASLRAGRRQLQAVQAPPPPDWTPPATLIVPVKGHDDGLAENLGSLAAQDYPDYELLIVARASGDPALACSPPGARVVIAGPGDPGGGEKIHNLLAAVEQARAASMVLAFADSDGRVEPSWLRSLVAPLQDGRVGATTGYRWYFPDQGGFWSLLRSAWNAVIFGGFGAGAPAFAWGGAMALRRETFRTARVPEFWRGAVSDDYRLTQAVRSAGLEIRFAPGAMVAAPGESTRGEFFSWAVRQMIITRVYAPRLWWIGLAGHVLYCGAQALGFGLLLLGRWWVLPFWLLTIVPGVWRAELRRRAARVLFPQRTTWLDRFALPYGLLSPVTTWAWLYTFVASAFTRTIEWRGWRYCLVSPSETRVVPQ
jgi:cellulose synthase/poly-beta-1,6-N-acetylglucosamine synthase-like glycosyltransferase